MSQSNEIKVVGHIQEVVANPSALGLFGLAMVTLVASTQKLEITEGTLMILPWAIFLGATAQLVAGLLDFKHNNTFGATAFCAYGFFWYAVGLSWMFQNGMFGVASLNIVLDNHQLGYGFLGYFIFTVIMTFGAAGANKVLFIIFFLIDLLFLGLFMNTLGWGGHAWHTLAAVAELAIAIMSFYGCAVNVLNSHYGYQVLPPGKPFGPMYKKKQALNA